MLYRIIIAATLIALTGCPDAWARKVYSPHVEQGKIEFESQTDVLRDPNQDKDGSVKQQFEVAYGITDWWSTGMYAIYTRPGNRSSYDYAETKWENIFVLPKWLGVDWGAYLEYAAAAPAQQANDIVEGKLLVEQRGEVWRHTLNITLKQQLSASASTASVGYAWRTGYAWHESVIALEAYGTLGPYDQFLPASRQSHHIGPVVGFEPWHGLELEIGWLMDVNNGPRYGDLKMNLEMEF